MVLLEVFKQLNNIFNFRNHDFAIRDIILKIRNKEYHSDKEEYVNNILNLLEIDIKDMDFQDKKELLKVNIGSISLNQHIEFKELWVFRYISEEVSWNNLWNKFYEQARGTVLNLDTFEVVNRAPNKFYNYGELRLPIEKVHEWIDNAIQMEFSNKEDGSFIALGFYNEQLIVNTPGSLQSEQSKEAYKMLTTENKYTNLLEYVKQNPNYTLCAEFIHPSFPTIINYNDRKDIILHSIINKETGEVSMYSEAQELANKLGISSVPIEFTDFSCINLTSKENFRGTDKEGWVGIIQHHNGQKLMVKVKCEDYCNLHTYLSKVQNPRHLLKFVVDDKLDDLIAKIDNPGIKESVSKIAGFISNQLSLLTDISTTELSNILSELDFEAYSEYSRIIHHVKNHPSVFTGYNINKGDFNSMVKKLEHDLKNLSDFFSGGINYSKVLENDEIVNVSFNLKDKLMEIVQKLFTDKLIDHTNEFLKGNFKNNKFEIQKQAKNITESLNKNHSDLNSKINEYRKQKSRFQMHLKTLPKSIESVLKNLEVYHFNINEFVKNINIEFSKENEAFDTKLYYFYKDSLISSDEYIEHCLKQEDIPLIEVEQIELFARRIDSHYFIEEDLIVYNQLIEKEIEELNCNKFSTHKVINEVKRLIHGEYIDDSYEVALKIFNEIKIDTNKIKNYFQCYKIVNRLIKDASDLTNHYVRQILFNTYRYKNMSELQNDIIEAFINDSDKIRYNVLQPIIYQLSMEYKRNNNIEIIE